MRNANTKPHILITIATHGDERVGFSVKKILDKLTLKKGIIEFKVANERAYKKKKRYINQDLNRSFPGNLKGSYEQRLAAQLLPKINAADVVIDIHSTTSQLRDALIVTKLNKETKRLIRIISPKYVLNMQVTGKTALISQAKMGIAFEYGTDSDKKAIRKVAADITKVLAYFKMINIKTTLSQRRTTYFTVLKAFPKTDTMMLSSKIVNYRLVKKGQIVAKNRKGISIVSHEDFYPILFGQKNYKDIFGFIGKRL